MPRIEDYALIGGTRSAALVSNTGSIDWFCAPAFDSPAAFAALLGGPEHGRWQIAPAAPVLEVRRRYLGETLVLETEFHTELGVVAVIDAMPMADRRTDIVRLVECRAGRVPMQMDLTLRFDYGAVVPLVTRANDGTLTAVAGPDAVVFHGPPGLFSDDSLSRTEFTLEAGQQMPCALTWHPSHLPPIRRWEPNERLAETEDWVAPQFAEVDVSVYEWMKSLGLSDRAIELAYGINASFGEDARDVSALLLFCRAAFSKVQRRLAPEGSVGFTAENGVQRIPESMAGGLKREVALGRPVVGIESTSSGVELRCADGTRVAARFAVCAVPFGVLNGMSIDPPLHGTQAEAELVGRDPDADVAVIKIDPSVKALQPVTFADSREVFVGQSVMAIGSPFGSEQAFTLTTGIVSGLG